MYTKAAIFLAILCAVSNAAAVSFDCKKASTFIENAICSNESLSKLDDILSETYKAALNQSSSKISLKNKQITWMKNVRNKCQNVACLEQAYDAQINQLLNIAYPPSPYDSAKADGYSYSPRDDFKPGEYVATQDVKTYSDAVEDKGYLWKEYTIKQGTSIKIYSVGTSESSDNQELWFNIAEGSACNGNLRGIFPPKGFDGIFLGAQGKYFRRIGDVPLCDK
ncbi:hypothetical protein SAMN02949497_1681 [Methylomagnum ishizawai]|uniref:Lysozyme inhibitor LprI-like N-terminal domain-containing protein n=1 Tax=Methylomagnum ishizawai TaxID=1760988 RepID=A0A1Y6CUN7_9GAMM|nr:lysozyme inhibitor LprI family protein [Methylomagnum ishizawai]SMF94369.1 hypothetical protein SAMN02949497_1681 [Methylomagnum ishizawai]